jgi:hypothetical protein
MEPTETNYPNLHHYLRNIIKAPYRGPDPQAERFFSDSIPQPPPPRSRREELKHHLEHRNLPWPLRVALWSMRRNREADREYDVVDAFVDVLTTLKPDCDAGRAVRWIGSQAGLPVERLQTRQELLDWFEEGAGKGPGSPSGERLAQGGADTAAVPGQTGASGRQT